MRFLRRFFLAVLGVLAVCWVGLVAYAYWPGEAEVPARALATPEDRFITVDGLELRYRSVGEPAPGKPTVVLLHGFANTLQTFRLLGPLLAGHFHVIMLDVPGFGLSSKPADRDYSNASQASVVMGLATALGLERYVVGGHSMGGTLSVYVAAADPRVSGVVLMNPGIITTGVPPVTQYLVFPLPRVMARVFGTREFRENFLRRSFLDESVITPQVMTEMMLAPRSEGYLAGTTTLMGQYETGEEPEMARRVKVPTLIAWGLQDRGKPIGELEALERLIPGAVVARIEGAGHYVQEEQPGAVADAMIAMAGRWQ
jgi:pimeloyl-ACP methyl ester carboxylesterase